MKQHCLKKLYYLVFLKFFTFLMITYRVLDQHNTKYYFQKH